MATDAERELDIGWNPKIAAILNLFIPGAGYIYMGRTFTGVSNFIAAIVLYGFFWGAAIATLVYPGDDGLTDYEMKAAFLLALLPVPAHLGMVFHPYSIAKKKRAKLAASFAESSRADARKS